MQPCDRLTAKEIQVAMLVWEGQTNREIANVVGTTEQVIKNYLRNTFDKLGVWSRLELALYVAAHGGSQWRNPIALPVAPGQSIAENPEALQKATERVHAPLDLAQIEKDDQQPARLPYRTKVSLRLISA
jgi:DNA-binding CsgD family transcriptional regulator